MQYAQRPLPPRQEVEKNIIVSLILTVITFGIYYLFWQNHQIKAWNRLLGFEKYGFWKWILLTIITFGLYHAYHEYVMAQDLVHLQRTHGQMENQNLPLICLVLTLFSAGPLADAVQQYELHRLYERHPSV